MKQKYFLLLIALFVSLYGIAQTTTLPYNDDVYTNGYPSVTLNNLSTCQTSASIVASSQGYDGIWADRSFTLIVNGSTLGTYTGTQTIDISSYIPITSVQMNGNFYNWSWVDLTVNITSQNASMPASGPSVTNVTYVEGDTASPLTATLTDTGTTLKWYTDEFGDNYSSTATTPSTATIGTTSYWVAQADASGCESVRSEIVVTVIPNTPATHLNFDGINDHVNLGTSLATTLNGTTALTLEAWINPSVLNGWNNIITDYNGSYHKLLLRVRNNNNIQFWLNGTVLNSSFTVPLDTWTHIAAAYDGSNMYVYANGVLVASQSATVSLPTTTDQFNIGSRIGSNTENFTGNIDEVRIWATARTIEQINGSMNCELQGNETGLLAYYNFNQGIDLANNSTETTLTDITSNGNNGTLTNFALTGATSNWLAGSPVTTGSVVPGNASASSPISYNQGDTASALSATTGTNGTGLMWYTTATGGTGSTTAPTPSTATAGSISYWVASTNANGCESERIEIVVNVTAYATHLNFDGASDRITGTNPNLPQGNSPRTIEAWVRNSTGNDMTIFNYGNINAATNQVYTLHLYNGIYIIGYFNDINTGYNINDGNWHHVAVSHDGSTSRIYVDGALINTTSITYNTNGYDFQIGTTNRNGSYLFNLSGSLDEVRVWNVALSQTDIQNTMNCELDNTQNNVVAYYKFNQGFNAADNTSLTTLTDSSGYGIDGTLTNFALTGTTSNWQSGSAVTTGNTCSLILSNSNFEANKLNIYPNPSSGIFTINSEEVLDIKVYDLIGKLIYSNKVNSGINQIDISNYSNGMYLLQYSTTSGKTDSMKLIKN